MLFAKKDQGFYFSQSEHAVLLARTSGTTAPFAIEEMRECPPGDADALAAAVAELRGKMTQSRYAHARCAVNPPHRLVRNAAIESKRAKDGAYLNELVNSQFRVDPDKFTLTLLNARDGAEFDSGKAGEKEAVFCGLPSDEIVALQEGLLAAGLYPERLEIGTVAVLGALADWLAHKQDKASVLALELDAETAQAFIVSAEGLHASRQVPHGLQAMIPVVQKELNLKDEESARKLFYSNTFDFTGMGPALIRKLQKELQSLIGFHEVQTGQSVSRVICVQIPPKLAWLEGVIASSLGAAALKIDYAPWLEARGITFAAPPAAGALDGRWLGLFSLMTSHDAVPA